MTAYARRQKTRPNYDPYAHENTHVFLPDGSEHVVKKTGVGRTSDEYASELRVLIDPWEKDAILEQAEEQRTPEWNKYVLPSGMKPLDKGGLRAARSNVMPDKVKNWDTFEISFDRADVATEDRQQAVFDEVVAWAKEIHTEGLEGGRRAFTIQEWHGLDGSSSRPHLRLEMHRIGWEPMPRLIPANGDRLVLDGKVQQRQNYAQESGETDKDFQPLVAALRAKFNIELQVGNPSLDRDADGRQAALAVPTSPTQALSEADRLLAKAQGPAVAEGEPAAPSGAVTPADKPFELRRPVDPFKDALASSLEKLAAAKREAELLQAAHLTYAANEQLQDQVKAQGLQITDLTTQVARRDDALAQKDQELEAAGVTLAQTQEKLEKATEQVAELAVALDDTLKENVALQQEFDDHKQATQATVSGLTQQVAAAEEALGVARQEAGEAKRERDALETRNVALMERNGELVGEKNFLAATLESTKQTLDQTQADLKMAREELAPMVAENASLKSEHDRLSSENAQLATKIKDERNRMGILLRMDYLDQEALAAKITRSGQLFDQLQEKMGNNPEALRLLQEVASLVKPRADYKSRADAYIEAGMPTDKESPEFKAFEEEVNTIHKADGEFGKTAVEVRKDAKAKGQLPEQQQGGPKPNPNHGGGPRPNPNAVGLPPPPKPSGGGSDRNR